MAKKTYTTAQLAAKMSCVPSTITRRAKELGLGKIVGGKLEFSEDEKRELSTRVLSNPGNTQMKNRKKAKQLGRKGGKA